MLIADIGEITLWASGHSLPGWLDCIGQQALVSDYPELFAAIGTAFGGDGVRTFGVPDLRGRVPIHAGPGYTHAQQGGTETVALGVQHIPKHRHAVMCSTDPATTTAPDWNMLAAPTDVDATPYGSDQPRTSLASITVEIASKFGGHPPGYHLYMGVKAHENRQPYTALRYVIAAKPEDSQFGNYIGEVRAFAFEDAPDGWLPCDGRILPIDGNSDFFLLINRVFGGDGAKTFGIPNLQGKVGVGPGAGPGLTSYALGDSGGMEFVPLHVSHMPHQHRLVASAGAATSRQPMGQLLAAGGGGVVAYAAKQARDPDPIPLHPSAVKFAGANQAHANIQPSLTVSYCIAVTGQFPPLEP